MQSLSFWLIFSILLTIVVETIKFKSIKKALYFMKHSPIEFILNVLIISSTLALSFMVTRKVFVFTIVTIFWLLLSITNTIVTTLRGYPLMFSDIFLIKEGLSLSSQYFTPLVISMVLILLGFLFWIGYDLFQIQFETTTLQYVMGTVYVFLAGYIFYKTEKKELPKPAEEVELYEQMGFAYSITDSLYPYLNRKPDSYSEEKMNNLAHDLMPYFKNHPQSEASNVIMIQMESFFDPLTLQNLSINIDPIPTIRHLMKTEPFGKLIVPTFGGGTGKTEFEVLTSMNVDYFGPGEIPHNSILKSTDIESLATHFSQSGFETIAIHNYEGNFYNRQIAISNLGFDVYVPLEYMAGDHGVHQIDKTDDGLLFDYVIQALEQSEEPDFIYAVTAGTHQPYSTTDGTDSEIIVSGDLSQEYRLPLQDYVNRMHSLDEQIKRLVEYVNNSDEPTLLVFFSDHLPNLSAITDESTYEVDLYQTPYLIYSNAALEPVLPYENMTSYQLGAYALNLLGIDSGAMHKIHDIYADSDHYQSILDTVQKDLLYGEGRFYENQLLPSI